ncbi:MAG: DUF2911 domain-containing protein [Chitinophagales bacterium]|nr:DUF2911 domain-containing protein [Chitinophagales bacterium]MBP9188329.1 DUF2911 domain-containing protein [Chitinophagales bacterium]MBP9704081.1 DUF2911 domain-containing protein [Chitinophagales bacterium]
MRIFNIIVLVAVLAITSCSDSQKAGDKKNNTETGEKENRVSPAETATATIGENIVTINYGSPRVKDRTIWGELVPYNEVWRAGANEATTISFTQDVMINGQLLKKDTYAFFAIPTATDWTIIFNLDEKQWGAFKYNETDDALRFTVTPVMTDAFAENLTFNVSPNAAGDGGIIQLSWEKLTLQFDFTNIPEK